MLFLEAIFLLPYNFGRVLFFFIKDKLEFFSLEFLISSTALMAQVAFAELLYFGLAFILSLPFFKKTELKENPAWFASVVTVGTILNLFAALPQNSLIAANSMNTFFICLSSGAFLISLPLLKGIESGENPSKLFYVPAINAFAFIGIFHLVYYFSDFL